MHKGEDAAMSASADIFDLFRKISTENSTGKAPVTHLIVGLGNPGKEYTFTRHNTGFLALDYLSQKLGVRIDRAKFHALTGDAVMDGKRVLLVKPQTFMNLSGEAVREAADFYKIPPENIIVLCDDITQEVGCIRVRRKGSDGGHNGLKNIIYQLNSDQFPRIRIGIGKKPRPDYDLAAWVLSEFTAKEKEELFSLFSDVETGIRKILAGDVDGAMQFCNARRPGGDRA